MTPVVSKVFALHPDICSVQVLELFLVASYRNYFPSSPKPSHEPIIALNLCVCLIISLI